MPGANGTVQVPEPSLHRPDLIAYLKGNASYSSLNILGNASLLRQVMLRPNTLDHPNFTGSNPNFDPVNGPWDVDNDGDGIPDSVWVDLGFPVRYTAAGIAYKPLFAILCADLGGRLNLNAHGNAGQSLLAYYQPMALPASPGMPFSCGLPNDATGSSYQGAKFAGAAGGTAAANLPRGQGTGPGKVNLLPLFCTTPGSFTSPFASSGSFNFTQYQALLAGGNGQLGRYGESVGTVLTVGAGASTTSAPSSPLNANRSFPYNGNYWAAASLDACGSPPDPQGFGAVGLDLAGRPVHISSGGTTQNSPYDLDLSRNAARASGSTTPDSPFSVAESEAVLRPFDRDSNTLPSRLTALTGNTLILNHRADVTAESFFTPTAPAVLPLAQRGTSLTTHPIDLIQAATGGTLPQAEAQAAALLPWETMQGLKMNVNRPFGAVRSRRPPTVQSVQPTAADRRSFPTNLARRAKR